MFQLQNQSREESGFVLPEVEVSSAAQSRKISKFDLTLSINETEEGLLGSIEYNTDLFDQPTIARMAGHLQQLVQGIVTNPDQTLSALPLLMPEEHHQIVREWNDTVTEYPSEKCVHQLFVEQVALTPDNVAAVFEDQHLTYVELNARANQLAHYLIERGVNPDTLVGLCVERSLEMLIGLLGILKAGGAYVPLDPNYPQSRLEYMVEDSGISIMLSTSKLDVDFAQYKGRTILLDDWSIFDLPLIDDPVTAVDPTNLAYVIYTSGSTGRPKGVMINHYALCNLVCELGRLFNINSDSRILQFSSFSFDAAVSEWSVTLCRGGALHIIDQMKIMPGLNLEKTIQESNITHILLPPAALSVMKPDNLQSLKVLILGGEACPTNTLQLWLGHSFQLINAYGPTESTICASVCNEGITITGIPSIGRPIGNTSMYILNNEGGLNPIGIAGELHISGVGLARGYLNRSELTKEKFVNNPYSTTPNEIMYKTGDLVRWLADGNIQYLGRTDHQVKIRGFRIELGEVENILSALPGVQEAILSVHQHDTDEKYLTGYVVMNTLYGGNMQGLRIRLKQYLPDYMIPSYIVELESLPRTPNGKIDRGSLAPPDIEDMVTDAYVPPTTKIEKALSLIWSEILEIPVSNISINGNFFTLGGHSLMIVKTLCKINRQYAIELPISDFFSSATIFSLSKRVESLLRLSHDPKVNFNKSIEPNQRDIRGASALFESPPHRILPDYIYDNTQILLSCCEADGITKVDVSTYYDKKSKNFSVINGQISSDTLSDSYFHISSNSKILVGLISCILVKEKYLFWNTEISSLHMLFDRHKSFRGVTINSLLSHTHGLDFSKMEARINEYTSMGDFVENTLTLVVQRGWGQSRLADYSSSAYSILMYIFSSLTGLSEKKLFEHYLFEKRDIKVIYLDDNSDRLEAGNCDSCSFEIDNIKNHTMPARIENQICLRSKDLLDIITHYAYENDVSAEYLRNLENYSSDIISMDQRYQGFTLGWLRLQSDILVHYGLGRGHHSLVCIDPRSRSAVVVTTNKVFSNSLFGWFDRCVFNNKPDLNQLHIQINAGNFDTHNARIKICNGKKSEFVIHYSSKDTDFSISNEVYSFDQERNVYHFPVAIGPLKGLCTISELPDGKKVLRLGNSLYEEAVPID